MSFLQLKELATLMLREGSRSDDIARSIRLIVNEFIGKTNELIVFVSTLASSRLPHPSPPPPDDASTPSDPSTFVGETVSALRRSMAPHSNEPQVVPVRNEAPYSPVVSLPTDLFGKGRPGPLRALRPPS